MQKKHLFPILMGIAFLCAFVLPASATDHLRIHVSGLFVPVSSPSRSLARSVYGSVATPPVQDSRASSDIVTENQWLKSQVLSLQTTVDRLQRIDAESQTLGDLRSLCVRAMISGEDAGGRDSLLLGPGISWRVTDANAPAVYDGGLAGRVTLGVAGARLRLITDTGMSVTGRFVRISSVNGKPVETPIKTLSPLVQGAGLGKLIIRDLKRQDVIDAQLRKGDWVVVDDAEYPEALQGWRIGQVTDAKDSRSAPGFVEVAISPQQELSRLPDVWVLKGSK